MTRLRNSQDSHLRRKAVVSNEDTDSPGSLVSGSSVAHTPCTHTTAYIYKPKALQNKADRNMPEGNNNK